MYMCITKFNNTIKDSGWEWRTELELVGGRSIDSIPDLMSDLYRYYTTTPVTKEYEKEMLNLSVVLCNDYIARHISGGFTLEEIQKSLQHTYPERFY